MASVPDDRLESLVLCWLLSRDEHHGRRSDVRKALERHVGDGSGPKKSIDDAVHRARLQGHIHERTPGRLELQERGKQKALSILGIDSLPRTEKTERAKWAWIRNVALVRVALGVEPNSAGFRRVRASDDVRAIVLQRHYGIAPGKDLSLKVVVDILCAAALGASRVDSRDVRTPVIRRWLAQVQAQPEPSAPSPASSASDEPTTKGGAAASDDMAARPQGDVTTNDLAAFAARALAAAKRSPTGRRDGDKVFVSHVFRELERSGEANGTTLADFKLRLVEAQKGGLLRLSRADLVEDMSPEDVRESEVERLSARLHFVRID